MIFIENLKIALLGFVLCFILSGCAHTVNALKTDADTETTKSAQHSLNSNTSPEEVKPDESTASTTMETESTHNQAPTTTPYTSTTELTPTPTPYAPTPTPAPTPTQNTSAEPTPEQVTYTYSVWAESGAVITSQDSSTGEFHYKQKCEACGDVRNGETLSFVKGGSGLTSSFTCSKCGSHQKLVIGWSCTKN